MPIAPLVAAWGSRWPRQQMGPLGLSGASPAGGVRFAIDDLLARWPNARLIVEAAFGADLTADPNSWNWYDITADVRQADGQRISITPMGRSDETSTAQPAGCTFQLANDSGDYTAYNANSIRHPYVRRNTPIRVTINLTGLHADDSVRFQGYANGWVPSWDISANLPIVTVSASGSTRRLGQGKKPFSSLRQYVTDTTTKNAPVAYWPMEDGSSALQATSAIDGMPPLIQLDGTLLPTFAGRASTPGTGPVVVFKSGSTLEVSGLNIRGPFVRIPFLLDIPKAPAATQTIMRVFTDGTAAFAYDLTLNPAVNTQAIGQKVWASFELNESGGNVSFTIAFTVWTVNPTSGVATPAAYIGSPLVTAGTLGNITGIKLSPFGELDDVAIGHLSVYSSTANAAPPLPSVFGSAAFMGYAGENAVTRLRRLCAAEGVPLEVIGTSDTLMGPEPVDTFLAKARDVEQADQGVLVDGFGPGLTFITRAARYNQTPALVVDANADELGDPFAPVDNDQRNRNLIKADRKQGGSATYEDETGPLGTKAIGTYDSSVTVNIHREVDLPSYASWLVHQGTVEGFRYPTLNLDLAAAPTLAPGWLASTVSSRVDVANVSTRAPQHPAGDIQLLLEGWGEQLSPFDWLVTGNFSPYPPWIVGVLDVSGYLDCGASVLSGDHDATTTTLSLLITDTCTWAHDDGDYVVVVDGEEMTVTAVGAASGSGSSWTQTLTVTRSVNGVVKSHPPGSEVHVRDPMILAL